MPDGWVEAAATAVVALIAGLFFIGRQRAQIEGLRNDVNFLESEVRDLKATEADTREILARLDTNIQWLIKRLDREE